MLRDAPRLGATIDGYAVEGGFDVEGGPYTAFNAAQALGQRRPSVRTPATYEHLGDLVDAAADLGLDEVRLTLEWARLEPRPGQRDEDVLAHYVGALAAAHARGLGSVVVLCDAAWPSWLGDEPWLSAWAPPRFAAHAAWVAERVEGLARAVVTFRAPNAAAAASFRTATSPPYRTSSRDDELASLDGMLLAHQLAVLELARCAPGVERAIVLAASGDYEEECLLRDVAAGIVDPVVLAARRDRFERDVSQVRSARRVRDLSGVGSLRSAQRWADLPEHRWWLASGDPDLLCAVLNDAPPLRGATMELAAGAYGWDAQLAVGVRSLAHAMGPGATIHLFGLVGAEGTLPEPVGLLEVDRLGGGWSARDVDDRVAGRLRALRRNAD